ncbi:1,4-dihydroxy-6-naphthoate synthase [Paraflavitalea pollutisoli]|uniref:1,4-dihydroxy-6-naphthoate synthase n=1 Tax=Paraflavitalea pollutisoli TaxID=3034143 RepID=UPI0023EBE599|nr:1,4-dihydroxy-6-naphthoate synthase [Paraflavitalea sp. H1-2-19X]
MKLTIGYSPCPNDTFIFDALVNKKIDTGDIDVEVVLEDVQTLNEWALQGKLDATKISYGVLPLVLDHYIVLPAGGALGKGVGPLLITRQNGIDTDAVHESSIAIPGENTTAHMLFSLAFPDAAHKKFTLFSKIEESVTNASVDAGVIIHENRFTYQDKGLVKLMDLGEYWETQTGSPIPLGGIVMKRTLGHELQTRFNTLIRRSVEYAFAHYPAVTDYVKEHAQEMSEQVMRQHIDLYVNNYSIDLGEEGRSAVEVLLDVYSNLHGTTVDKQQVFLT